MAKNWVPPRYLPKQGELENYCFVAVLQRMHKLWPQVQVMLKWSYTIDFSSWISPLFVMMQGSRRKTYPVIYS